MSRTVLITGATGSVSSALLDALDGSALTLRALVRDRARAGALERRGIEVVTGDLGDPGTLPRAFKEVDDLWLLTAMDPRAPENSMNALWAARRAEVRRVVRLSAIGAAHDAPTRNGRLHALSDHELQSSGLCWTILRPHAFMQNLLWQAERIAHDGVFSLNMGQGRLGMIDLRDVADVAAHILRAEPERHHGRIYTPSGPQTLTYGEAAEQLGQVLGRTIRYVAAGAEDARAAMVGSGISPWLAGMLVEYGQALGAGFGDYTTTDVEDVTGRPPRRFADFARDHRAAFR
ncbi:NAD-dependent epimerase/dehydratase family protein [Nonomuraea sp. KC401]|uniref:NAD(P)H-binding protein n=1 Tax=unclassified Nonomuraea TaxID=2593643 RepID=UPI0010FEB98F|nr:MULTISPECIES: NAD(P)H-binding protein [unclassified Nonomuraea]NBE95833.1 NAD(P)H-binding protein [Nonomuraea sp. K271]TLF71973.1 NAD-dependent epimerase/dehydratase family protein [Nonomuraea sp. KC401]